MAKTLEQVIADWRERATGCRRVRDERVADLLDEICDEVSDVTEDYRTWLSERDAMLKSGRKSAWLRNQFAAWERQALARWDPTDKRARQYRSMIIPARTNVAALRADARTAARGEGHAA